MQHDFIKHVRKTFSNYENFFMSHQDFDSKDENQISSLICEELEFSELKVTRIIPAESRIDTNLSIEMRKEMDNLVVDKIVETIHRVGRKVMLNRMGRFQKFMYRYFGSCPKIPWTSSEDLANYILTESQKIKDKNKKSGANFLILPYEFAMLHLLECSQFQISDDLNRDPDLILFKIGMLEDIEVFGYKKRSFNNFAIMGASFEDSSMLDKIAYVEGSIDFQTYNSLQGDDCKLPHKIAVLKKKVCITPLRQADRCFISLEIEDEMINEMIL